MVDAEEVRALALSLSEAVDGVELKRYLALAWCQLAPKRAIKAYELDVK